MRNLITFLSGLLFAIGLGVSGMTSPDKVVGFLDVAGSWDPSLAFVMMGAIAVSFVGYRLIRGREAPVLEPRFLVPTRRDIDLRLVGGAALFGLGWGLGGFCPGPGLVSLGSGAGAAVVFVLSMVAGMVAFHAAESWCAQRRAAAEARGEDFVGLCNAA